MNNTNTPEDTINAIRTLKNEAAQNGLIVKEVMLPTEEFELFKHYLDRMMTYTMEDSYTRTDLEFEGVKIFGHPFLKLSALLEKVDGPGSAADWEETAKGWKNAHHEACGRVTYAHQAIKSLTADVDRLIRERDNWESTAAQNHRNTEYYQGLLDQIAVMLGFESLISDDGSLQDSPLRAKLPEVLTKKILRLWELEAWQERNLNQWTPVEEPSAVSTSRTIPGSHVENSLAGGLVPKIGSVWSFEEDVFTVSGVSTTRVYFDKRGWHPLQCFFEIFTPVINAAL